MSRVLDVRRLRTLYTVVSTGSVKEAALQLNYSPSAVSQAIAALERDTNTVLLEPAGRGVRPTSAGRLLAEHAGAVLDRLAEAEACLESLRAGETGRIRLASFATAGATLVPRALAKVKRSMPNLEVDLRVAETDDAFALLRNGALDVAVVEMHEADIADVAAMSPTPTYLLADPYRVVLPKSHPLARRRVLRLSEMDKETWVEVMCDKGCCARATEDAFLASGVERRVGMQADEYWPAQGFVAAGLGVALVPTLGLGSLHEGVVARRLHPSCQPVRYVLAIVRPSSAGTHPIRELLAAAKEAAAEHTASLDGPFIPPPPEFGAYKA